MMMEQPLQKDAVLTVLRRHKEEIRRRFGIEKMALFGSVARNEATVASDVDIAIIQMRKKSYWLLLDFIEYASALLGCRVEAGFYESMRVPLQKWIKRDMVDV